MNDNFNMNIVLFNPSSVVPRVRPPSQSGRRASSGNVVVGNASPSTSPSGIQAERQRPLSSQSLDNESLSVRRAIMLQRQNATTVEPDSPTDSSTIYENFPHTPPRPPSEPRPKSAKGRPRSGSRRSSGGAAVDVTTALSQSLTSFSKYKPLPSIGSRPSSGSSSSHQSCDTVMHYDILTFDKKLSEKVNELSLVKKYTVPTEPSEREPNRIHLAIKVLDGSRHERWFRLSDSVGDILAFAESVMGERLPDNCELCTNDPPTRTFSDLSLTLEDIGLDSRTVLYIQES
jgi:hypothetical protein